MPNQTPEHMQRLAGISASRRRATKIAHLIDTAPPLEADQVSTLHTLLDSRVDEVVAPGATEQDKQARLERYIQQIVDAAPPLDAATRDRLALLLRGAGMTS